MPQYNSLLPHQNALYQPAMKDRYGRYDVGGPIGGHAGTLDKVYDFMPWRSWDRFKEAARVEMQPDRMGGAKFNIADPYGVALEATDLLGLGIDVGDAARIGRKVVKPIAGRIEDAMQGLPSTPMRTQFGVIGSKSDDVIDIPVIDGGKLYRGSPNKGAATFSGAPTGDTDTGRMFLGSKETADLYGRGGKIYEADVAPGRYIDASTKQGSDLVQQFKAETGINPYLKHTDRGSAPNWTVQYDFEKWLDSKGIDYDGVFYGENNGTASLALKNRDKVNLKPLTILKRNNERLREMAE